jgi:hypothetical protein
LAFGSGGVDKARVFCIVGVLYLTNDVVLMFV